MSKSYEIVGDVSSVVQVAHEDGDEIVIQSAQQIGGILEQNKLDYNNYSSLPKPKDGGLRHVARIPDIIIHKWLKEENINLLRFNEEDQKRMHSKLNDSNWQYLRTAPGTI